MNDQFQESKAGASAGNEDATAKAGNGSGSGEGQPSAPKADPPAAGDDANPGNQTAPDMAEVTRKAIEGSDTLQKLAGKKTDDKQGDQPAAKPGEKPAKPPEKAAAGKPDAGKQDTNKPAAYEPQDPKAREAFAKLRTENKAKDEELARLRKSVVTDEVRERAAFGEQISKALESVRDDFEVVTDEQLADVVSVRGAINRMSHALENGQRPYATDMRTFEAAYRSLHDLAKQLGVSDDGAGGEVLPEPLTGELPARWAKLVEYGDLTEKEARLHAAVEAAAGGRSRPESRTRQPERQPEKRDERKPEAKPLPMRSRQQEQQSLHQEDSPEEKLYKGRTRQFLIDAKVAASPQEAATHWKTHLLPIIIRELVAPAVGEDPVDHFLSLKPETRFALAKEAQQLHAERSKQSDPPPDESSEAKGGKPKAPLFQRSFTTRRGLATPTDADERKDNSKKVLGFLAGKSAEG